MPKIQPKSPPQAHFNLKIHRFPAKFTNSGPEIESIISYGSSDKIDSKHYSDQMDLYLSFKTKKMTLDKKQIYETAEKIYHPE